MTQSHRSFDPRAGTGKLLTVVIHAESPDQAVANAITAREHGADGIWLINHNISAPALNTCFEAVRGARSDFERLWIGLNYLDSEFPEEAFSFLPKSADAIWFDDAGYDEGSQNPVHQVMTLRRLHQSMAPQVLLFGGIAHKGNNPVMNVGRAAALSAPHLDVIVTTGPGTGHAADIEKIRMMKEGAGSRRLALASGVTAENVQLYLPHIDLIMVATGVSKSFTEIDPEKMRQLSLAMGH